ATTFLASPVRSELFQRSKSDATSFSLVAWQVSERANAGEDIVATSMISARTGGFIVSSSWLEWMRPASAEPLGQLFRRMRYQRTELLDPRIRQPRRRPRERNRAQRLGVLVVDRRCNASRCDRMLLVIERPPALAYHAHARPHRF